ncbi:MAG: hypothetical protein E7414_01525 [Ruminococcaceae bacterium]|nr:hypothetical protein [Oscillospiraceae bacterium]
MAGLCILGVLIRFLFIWKFPAGLNQDEASIGYDAFADLTFGMDRNGDHNPVYSVAWGSGHSSLYLFLIKPFIALFGLNTFSVRIVNAIFGSLALFAFYGTAKKLRGPLFSLVALFMLVINPWHIMMSRWGLECNLFPNVFLIGLYFLLKGEEKRIFYPLSLFIFGLSLYAYGTSYMFVPVFLGIAAICLYRQRKIELKMLLVSAAVFIVTAIPIFLFMCINIFQLKPMDWGFLSFPRLAEGRYHTTVTVLGGDLVRQMLRNLGTFLKILITGNDGLIWNSIPGFGVLYMFSLPFVFLGLYSLCTDKKNKGRFLLITMLPAIFVLVLLSEVNINRANIVFPLIIYLAAEGIYMTVGRGKGVFFSVITVYLASFCIFTTVYFTSYQKKIGSAFFEGFGEALTYAAEQTDDTIYMTEYVNAPYIFALFYEKEDPQHFIDTVDYAYKNTSVRPVNSFGRYVTGLPEELEKTEICIASEGEAVQYDDANYEKKKFGGYVVISGRK